MKFLRPVRLQFVLGLGFGLIAAMASGAGLPFIIKYLVPLLTSDNAPKNVELFIVLLSIPLAFGLRALGTFLNAYYMAYVGMHVLESLRIVVFNKIQELPLNFFNRNNVGDLMSRVIGDTAQLQTGIIKVANSLVKEPATLIAAISALIYLAISEEETVYMLIVLAAVPACVFPIKIIGTRILKKAKQAQEQAGQLNNVLNENLGAVREVRAYNMEAHEIKRFQASCRKLFKLTLKTVKYDKALSPLIEFISAFAILFALYASVTRSVQPDLIAAILTALYMCYEPVKKLGTVSNTINRAKASLNRLEYILHTEDSVPEHPSPIEAPLFKGKIRFEDVDFSYRNEAAISNINVQIEPGEVVALVGPSGAGKSTFANMVMRFYDPQKGRIFIDDYDIRNFRKRDVRSQLALISQEAILFNESIAWNIGIGRKGAGPEEIRQAAERANAADFIEKLDGGYDHVVGERGGQLSGGQRQRISIARAFLKNAPILILDEPTSALDSKSEHAIQNTLQTLSPKRTVLIIAHRFSTIQSTDRILVFNAGSIVATGTHSELYASNALYKNLYDKQTHLP